MKHKLKLYSKGFTLTEVLLAVMIVGLIGIALASLSRASAREAGVARSRIVLRNNAAMFVRTLRRDIEQATQVKDVLGATKSPNSYPLLKLQLGGGQYQTRNSSSLEPIQAYEVVYCFWKGTDQQNIVPANAYRGGEIWRFENRTGNNNLDCNSLKGSTNNQITGEVVLDHVKYIPTNSGVDYPVPLFAWKELTVQAAGGNSNEKRGYNAIQVNIITELNSKPIVNDAIEETFSTQLGWEEVLSNE